MCVPVCVSVRKHTRVKACFGPLLAWGRQVTGRFLSLVMGSL